MCCAFLSKKKKIKSDFWHRNSIKSMTDSFETDQINKYKRNFELKKEVAKQEIILGHEKNWKTNFQHENECGQVEK